MDRKYLDILEVPKILERLAAHTSFSASRELALSLLPATDLDEVLRRQSETEEARTMLDVTVGISVGGARDVRPLLDDSRRGIALLPIQLLEIKTTLLSGRSLRNSITRQGSDYPRLADIASRIEDCPHVTAEISRCIDERGDVVDDASPALGRIRRELRVAHDRVIERLNRLISASDTSGYLQEPLVTQRSGRYVIPLKAEFKGRIPGLIHDQSSSGATLFIEPLATVELNNQWRALQLEEEDEVRRILAQLSALIAEESEFIERTVESLAELDLAFAKAKYAQVTKSTTPIMAPFGRPRGRPDEVLQGHPGSTIDLRRARHPLLDPVSVVPIDVHLGPDYFIIVITGPNTGGKTVSLKTVGLLAVMAQAGLGIPAEEGSRLSVFKNIFADIGDEQSIEQSLSTFSSHMSNIVGILAKATPESLVLLDELGAGTDPEEGSALARAILSYLVRHRITTLATTHYSELKIYAHSTPGVQNASVEFDLTTLSPTYELTIGLPGRSNAFAIASRLGLRSDIVEEASQMVSTESLEAEGLLAQIRDLQQEAKDERHRAAATREESERLRQDLAEKLREIEAARREVLEQAREEGRMELEALRRELAQMESQARTAMASTSRSEALGQIDSARRSLDQAEESLRPLETEPAPVQAEAWVQPHVGDTVWVDTLNADGEVTAVDEEEEEAEVQVGSFRIRVPSRSVSVHHHASARTVAPPATPNVPHHVPRPPMELDLRGMRAEEALTRLEKHLDDALLAGLPWTRIIHGKGTGALRQAVREYLAAYPHVTSFRPGRNDEGGEGVTVVSFDHT